MTREEAIKTLRELWRETNDSWYEEAYNMAIEALSADAVQGEWLTGKGTSMMCPVCGTLFNKHTDFFDFEEFANFCPNCGARMKGGEDE